MTNEKDKAPERVWVNSLPESGRVTAYVSPIREVGSGRSLSLAEYVHADLLAAARKEEREAAFKEAIEIVKRFEEVHCIVVSLEAALTEK